MASLCNRFAKPDTSIFVLSFEYRISIPGNSYRPNDFRTLELRNLEEEQLIMINIDVFKSISVEI